MDIPSTELLKNDLLTKEQNVFQTESADSLTAKTQKAATLLEQATKKEVNLQENDSLEKTNAQVEQNMPPVLTQLQAKPVQVTSAYGKRIEATRALLRTKKLFRDSGRMRKIKNSLNMLNDYLMLEMPKEEHLFQQACLLRIQMYRQLHRLCQEYIEARSNVWFSTGEIRLNCIREIDKFLLEEQAQFEESAREIFEQSKDQQKRPDWTSVLEHVRTQSVDEVPQGCEFARDSVMTDEQKQQEKNKVAVSRMARLFGVSRLFEETKRVRVNENGKEETGYITPVHGTTMEHLEQMLEEEKKQNPDIEAKIGMSDAIFQDVYKIRALDHLFGFKRKPSDYAVEYEIREEGKKKQWIITSIKAINNEAILTLNKENKEAEKQNQPTVFDDGAINLDREMASRYLSLPAGMIKLALTDLLDQDALEDIESNRKLMNKRLLNAGSTLKDERTYTLERKANARSVLYFMHAGLTKEEQEKRSKVLIAQDEFVGQKETEKDVILRPGKQSILAEKFDQYDQWKQRVSTAADASHDDWTDEGKQLLQAAKAYFEAFDQKKGDAEVRELFKTMMAKLREWQKAAGKSEQEQKECTEYDAGIREMHCMGSAQGENSEIPEKVTKFDTKMLDETKDNKKMLEVDDEETEEQKQEEKTEQKQEEKKVEKKKKKILVYEYELVDLKDEPLFVHKPNLLDIRQGEVGDCYLISAFGLLAKKDPDSIMRMMEDHGATVTVTFPGGKKVTVSKKIVMKKFTKEAMEEIRKNPETYTDEVKKMKTKPLYANGALWVQILEKAYAAAGLEVDRGIGMKKLKGGNPSRALANISEYERRSLELDMTLHTVDDASSSLNTLWKQTLKNKTSPQGMDGKQWKKMKEFLKDSIQGALITEMRFRYQRAYKKTDGNGAIRGAVRGLTIEDIQETLRDVRNWTAGMGFTGYEDLLVKLKKAFPGLDITQERLNEYLSVLAEELATAAETGEEQTFEHRGMFGTTGKISYSKNAMKVFKFIKNAVDGNNFVSVSTKKFKPENTHGAGVNGESVIEGIAGNHAYGLIGYREEAMDDGSKRYFLQLNNPWGRGLIYEQHRDAKGNEFISGRIAREEESTETGGTFEVELNDFLQFFEDVQLNRKMTRLNLGLSFP